MDSKELRNMARDPFALPSAVSASTLPADEVELYYDYDWLPEEQRLAAQEATRTIKRTTRRVQGELLSIARQLLSVKNQKLFPNRQFGEWAETEFDIKPRQVQMMMNVARTYPDVSDLPLVIDMGDTVAMLVAQPSVPEAARLTIEEKVAAGEKVTVDDAKATILESRQKRTSVAHVIEQVRTAMAEIDDTEEVKHLLTGPQEDLVDVLGEDPGRVPLGAAARTVLKEHQRQVTEPDASYPVTVKVPRWAVKDALKELASINAESVRILWRSLRESLN